MDDREEKSCALGSRFYPVEAYIEVYRGVAGMVLGVFLTLRCTATIPAAA